MTKPPKRDIKRSPLNMRTTQELRDQLDTAAAESGRSLAQEVEYRLELSFLREREIYGNPATEALVKSLVMAIRYVESTTGKRWTDDMETATEAFAAAHSVMMALAVVPPDMLKKKLAGIDVGQMVKQLRFALDLWNISTDEIRETYAKGAGKPSTSKK
jgi:hypothetical protein